jgi:deoxyribonuclease IV
MKRVGAHVSIAGGIFNSVLNAAEIGARAFAIFTKNQKQWYAKPIPAEQITKFKKLCAEYKYSADCILPHDSYLINLGHPDKAKLQKSRKAFLEEMQRCEVLNLKMLNFHPGSHLGKMSTEECLETISESVNLALNKTKNVIAVIENTAGQGNNVGYQFEHIARIIQNVEDKNRIGVCLDTCHTFTAGYDLRTEKKYNETIDKFDHIIGLKYLKGMHLNDSKRDIGSKVDRHASIGKGKIGLNCFKYIMKDNRMEDIPLILETPDSDIWSNEIKLLYSLLN